MNQDEDHLRLLSIFHYVVAGLAALVSLFPVLYLVLGLAMVFAPGTLDGRGEPPPAVLGWIFVLFSLLFIFLGWVFAAFVFMAGRFLSRRTHYLFCLVMAGVECVFTPFGTALGIFTIIVLMREEVKAMFPASRPKAAAG